MNTIKTIEIYINFTSAGLAVPFVELTVAHASVLTILAISFERYYAICEPLRAGYVCTKTRATLICALAWFFAALFTRFVLKNYLFQVYVKILSLKNLYFQITYSIMWNIRSMLGHFDLHFTL